MHFNLIEAAWLPIRRLSGRREWLSPGAITREFDADPVLALEFPRADWNGAVAEWLVGLLCCAMPPEGPREWARRFAQPPDEATLSAALAPLAFAFDLLDERAPAFQDADPLAEQEARSPAGLLIDAPGENALKNNTDLFVKRGAAGALCLPYAAAALITLQTYAPSGGVGHRTSLRGGGPLTTLMAPRRRLAGREVATLWDRIWANVPDLDWDRADPVPGETPPEDATWPLLFPWLAATRTSEKNQTVSPDDMVMRLAFFACPRRIRLVAEPAAGRACALGGPSGEVLVTGYRTRNYGASYGGWLHPLSPYRHDKKAGQLPLHPQSGPSNYGDWIAWWGAGEGGTPAFAVGNWAARRAAAGPALAEEGLEAFGFDMDNAKARQWLEARLPWLPLYGEAHEALRTTLGQLVTAAREAASALRYALRLARWGQRDGNGYRLPDQLPKEAAREDAELLWRLTEGFFRARVGEAATSSVADHARLRAEWFGQLRRQALGAFDDLVDTLALFDVDPRRPLKARSGLAYAFRPEGTVAAALDLREKNRKERVGKAGRKAPQAVGEAP